MKYLIPILILLNAGYVNAQTYNARTDLTAVTESVPSLCSPAPCTMISTDLNAGGVTYYRVTDANTLAPAGFSPRQFGTSNSIDDLWSVDDSSFTILNLNGSLVPITLNTSTNATAPIPCSNVGDVNCVISGGTGLVNITAVEASYSKVTPNILYITSGTAISKIDFRPTMANPASSTVKTTVATFSACPNIGATGGGAGLVSISAGDTRVSTTLGTSQDNYHLLYVWDSTNGCRWLNTSTMTTGGDWGPAGSIVYHDENGNVISTVTYSDAHGSQIDSTGRWGLIDSEVTNNGYQDFWDIGTLNVYQCGVNLGSGSCVGHGVWGFSNKMWFLTNDNTSAFHGHTFPPALPATNLFLNTSPPLPVGFGGNQADAHINWNNNLGNNLPPFLVAPICVGDINCAPPTVAWLNELILMSPSGSGPVYRIAETYSHEHDFNAQVLPQISPSGKYAIFCSDWRTTRDDLFLVQLPLITSANGQAITAGVTLTPGASVR